MGYSHLAQITEALMRCGKEGSAPAAVVHGGFDTAVTAVRGTLSDIAAKAAAAQIQTPAVIIIGDVCGVVNMVNI